MEVSQWGTGIFPVSPPYSAEHISIETQWAPLEWEQNKTPSGVGSGPENAQLLSDASPNSI